MAESIAEAETEGAMDEFEDPENARGARNDDLLLRGLPERITGRPTANDPFNVESKREDIIRGKQPMTLSQQEGDGRLRRRRNKGMQEAKIPSCRKWLFPLAHFFPKCHFPLIYVRTWGSGDFFFLSLGLRINGFL